MNKRIVVAIAISAFLVGAIAPNFDLLADASSGDSNSVWKKLEQRIDILEERVSILESQGPPNNADIKYVQLKDDEAGNTAGWSPDGIKSDFFIIDNDVTSESIVNISIIVPTRVGTSVSETPSGVVLVYPNQGFSIGCVCGHAHDGAILNYQIITPKSTTE